MPVNTHAVVLDDVKRYTLRPLGDTLTATSKPVSTSDVDEYIEAAASEVNARLESLGVDLTTLATHDNAYRKVRALIARGAALEVDGHFISRQSSRWGERHDDWERDLDRISSFVDEELGAAAPKRISERSDYDPTNPRNLRIGRQR